MKRMFKRRQEEASGTAIGPSNEGFDPSTRGKSIAFESSDVFGTKLSLGRASLRCGNTLFRGVGRTVAKR